MNQSMLSRRLFLAGALGGVSLAATGCTTGDDTPTATAATAATGAVGGGGIGFDLWAGVPGLQYGQPVNKVQGSRRIKGPISWKNPISGKTLQVYVRTNIEDNGTKYQYFTMRRDGTALARVFDRRPGKADRYFVDDAFVPMGRWGKGQSRSYSMTEYQNGKARKRRVTLKLLEANYTYDGVAHSMKYDWISKKTSGKTVFHERYIFSPGIGFVDFANMLK